MTSPSDTPESGGPGPNGSSVAGRYYGRSIPYLPINDYPGKLIAVEGTDGVGRSTQIQLLREWLEVRGYGVIETGWTRSPLMPRAAPTCSSVCGPSLATSSAQSRVGASWCSQ